MEVNQGEGEERDEVERVTPGENQGLEVVVDRHSDRRVKSSFKSLACMEVVADKQSKSTYYYVLTAVFPISMCFQLPFIRISDGTLFALETGFKVNDQF